MSSRRSLPLLTVGISLVIIMAASIIPGRSADGQTPKYGGVLKIIQKDSPMSIGYPPDIWGADFSSVVPVFERIAWQDAQGVHYPHLAESWKVAADKKSLTLALRKGIKFHDGTDFNAEAVKFNIELVQKEPKRGGFSTVTSMEVVDPHTLRLHLKKYDSSILDDFSGYYGFASPTAIKKNGLEWAKNNPVGTGPFEFVSYSRGSKLVYRKFKGYWQKGKPYLDGIEILYIKDPMTQVMAFKAGEGQAITLIQPKTASELRSLGYQVRSVVSAIRALCPDDRHDPVLANRKVREAMDYAINKKAIAETLGYGFWEPLYQFSPSTCYGYNPDLKVRSYNPERARQLLAEAGYPGGFKTKAVIATQYANRDAKVAIMNDLDKVGIKLELDYADPGRWNQLRTEGWDKGFIYGLFGASANFAYQMSEQFGSQIKRYVYTTRPEGWDDSLQMALQAEDPRQTKALTQKAIKAAYDNVTFIPLWATSSLAAMDKALHSDFYTYHHMFWKPEDDWLNK